MRLLTTLPLLAFALPIGASTPSVVPSNETTTAATSTAEMERALETIQADKIKADLYFIASDQLEGRDTPSSGLRIAARFLRARLERLGWQPGAQSGFLYEYFLQEKRVDREKTFAEIVGADETIALTLGTDYSFSSRGLKYQERFAPLVYCGEGTEEDLAELDLEGKLALVTIPSEGPWFRAYRRVQKANAIGMVWVGAADATDEPFGSQWEGWNKSLDNGRPGWPATPGAEPGFTTLTLANARASQLFALAGFAEGRPEAGTELSVSFRDNRSVDPASPRIALENVCGFWPGSDPELKNEVIIISAHYDHVGIEGEEIYNGADDNGSGTCTLLAVAEALKEHGPMRRSVMLMWVSGEEKGLLGSKAWAMEPWLPEGVKAVCNINIDMVGRNDPGQLHITPTDEHEKYNGLTRLAESLSPSEGFAELGSADQYYSRSDHAMFEEHMGLPVCFLFSDVHEDYHKPTDTPDKVDYDKVRRVSRLVLKMIAGLQTDTIDF